jgi:hypothetical protein
LPYLTKSSSIIFETKFINKSTHLEDNNTNLFQIGKQKIIVFCFRLSKPSNLTTHIINIIIVRYGLNPPKRAPPSAPNAGPTASDPKTSATLGGKVPISLGKAAPPPPPQANKPKRAIPAPVQPGAGVAGVQSPQHTQQWTPAPAKAKQSGGTGASPRQLPTLPQRPNEQLSPRTNPSVPKVTSTPPQSPRDQDSGPSAVHTPTKAVTAALTTQLAQALPGHSGPSSGSPTSSAPTSLSASTNSSVQVTPASTPRPVSSEQSLPELSDAEKEKIRRVEKKKARIRSILEAHAEEVQKLDLKSYDAKKATLCQSVIRSWFAKQEYKFLSTLCCYLLGDTSS